MDLTTLEYLKEEVINAREELEHKVQISTDAGERYRETAEYKAYVEKEVERRYQVDAVTLAEEKLRVAALKFYNDTKEKKPIVGVEIKIRHAISYDKAECEPWIRANAQKLLEPNWKKFEDVADTLGAPARKIDIPSCNLANVLLR
jgi:hypothetical protein